jgi:large subunit ribosomal protein L13
MTGEELEIIDGEGLILGRLASEVARELLKGKKIAIINAEKIVISGRKEGIFKEYKRKKDRGSRAKGPFFPKMPDRIVKRTIRGMVPYKKARGREALSRLRVFLGVPEGYEKKKGEKIEKAKMERLSHAEYVTLEEVSEKLGWEKRKL